MNEKIAGPVRDRPCRFGGFAMLPLSDADVTLAELAYALHELHLDGVVIQANSWGRDLG